MRRERDSTGGTQTPIAWRLLLSLVLAGLGLFGLHSTRAWDAERLLGAAARHGQNAVQGVLGLQMAVAAVASRSTAEQVEAINTFFNRRVVFREDRDGWGQVDYWASPMESLQRGTGDCEDYAIAKYFTLTAMGVPHSSLRLVYVRAAIGGPGGIVQAHMVLAYYPTPEAEPQILDNLISEVRPASRRPDLTPVFSFNAEGVWSGTGNQSAGESATKLSRWQEVLSKARQEGF